MAAQTRHLARVPKESANHAEITAGALGIELAEQAQKAMGSAGKLRARLEQNADDHEGVSRFGHRAFGAGERETAIRRAVDIVQARPHWDEQAARRQLVKFFEAMGPTDPLTVSARRRLSALMFS